MRLWRFTEAICTVCFALFTPACNDDLVEEVPTDICASGKRWAGELTANEEMYPGRDCIDCHKKYDGPEFLAAGTIYGLVDPDGTRTTENDCFGVEGASVTITSGDGQVMHTLSNRAGNFFFEGRESSLVKPFTVVVEYTLRDGRRAREPMASSPSYGGCARCHDPNAAETSGATAGRVLAEDEVVGDVFPIYTGPVHE